MKTASVGAGREEVTTSPGAATGPRPTRASTGRLKGTPSTTDPRPDWKICAGPWSLLLPHSTHRHPQSRREQKESSQHAEGCGQLERTGRKAGRWWPLGRMGASQTHPGLRTRALAHETVTPSLEFRGKAEVPGLAKPSHWGLPGGRVLRTGTRPSSRRRAAGGGRRPSRSLPTCPGPPHGPAPVSADAPEHPRSSEKSSSCGCEPLPPPPPGTLGPRAALGGAGRGGQGRPGRRTRACGGSSGGGRARCPVRPRQGSD